MDAGSVSVPVARSLRIACLAVGAYLQHTLGAVRDWLWPQLCDSETLAADIRALRGELAGLKVGPTWSAGVSVPSVPYAAIAVWSLILVVTACFIARTFSREIVVGSPLAPHDGSGSTFAAASGDRRPPRRTGAAPARAIGDGSVR
jgi:hypothetical protein